MSRLSADQSDSRPVVAVTMGDPLGIGPEVTVKALADRTLRSRARFRVYGMSGALNAAAERASIEPFWWRMKHDSGLAAAADHHDVLLMDYEPPDRGLHHEYAGSRGQPTRSGGAASFRFVEDAIAAAKRGRAEAGVDAIVTGPISKEAWSLAGRGRYPGHTELLTSRFNVRRSRMMFVSERLRVILATVHMPLMEIRNVLTLGLVFDTIDLGHEACLKLGIERPRIAVCGLNPHAGEGGLFGDEEYRVIEPAIQLARNAGMEVTGPWPADTIFNAAVAGRHDLVVAMYHDQGLIPVKLLAWDSAVNATVGLPVVRTSPDHGTAFDISGQNKASPGSMRSAIELAISLVEGR
ncbi:MAG: 4-hydroxythreonine-4-phosphate dehydrogenase PdxA [Phycisphaerales bacterium]|nr:4-hydroxythreonine-4-phosphate dehydrogenase PdxA [Phycisphaerales bacterium]